MKPLSTQTVGRSPSTEWLTEYTLTQQGGQEFRSADLAGTPHVVNFFFASCPSYCRMQSLEVQKLATEFGPSGVVFLSITCDPDNDSPAALQTYAGMFNANQEHWKFLTGEMLLLRRIGGEMYEVPVDTQTHSEHLIVIDKWGQTRGRFRWRNHPEELVELEALLPQLLAETEPPEPAEKPALVIDEETGLLIPATSQDAPETPGKLDETTDAASAETAAREAPGVPENAVPASTGPDS